ncbi:TIGR02597 family protein [Cerasicoccus frondis]|uniref:TIGR02597 family protein n=1 Tax=Cerasicoccus frondis TaxID=490090 RepID=UPI0028525123|nr:TIGR02597 family protein [Cerasicoccus frondis]
MKISHLTVLAGLALAAPLNAATTEILGGMVIDCPAGSDTAIGIPFTRPIAFQGTVLSVSENQIILNGSPDWSIDEFVYEDGVQDDHYYVLFATGAKEGAFYTITSNDSNSITVDLDPYGLGEDDDLADVATGMETGDTIKIIPHWTPGALIDSDGPNDIELLLYSNNIAGTNLAASNSYQHYTGYGWYDGGTPVENNILFPYEALTLRNSSGSDYQLVIAGGVPMEAHRSILRTIDSGVQQDNRIVFLSPIPEMIGNVDLNIANLTELLIFDNDLAAQNKAPSNSIIYYEGYGWYDGGTRVDDPTDVPNQFFLQPGQSYILRKPAANAENVVWTAVQSYLSE